MSDQGPLIVPIDVQAMVINNGNMNFVRGAMKYGQLASSLSPSPAPFQNDEGNGFAAKTANQGVYLLWTLPRALRHGNQNADGTTGFPLVPNRWLVVRLYRPGGESKTVKAPAAAAWVVQSDFLDPKNGTSAFLDPTAAQLTPTLIGRKVAITDKVPWREPEHASRPFLRAVTESNPALAAYQPFNENVFSLMDDLASQQIGAGILSYFVMGWYSDAGSDVLASWQATKGKDFNSLLAQLQWTATATSTARSSLYHGGVFGVSWQPGGPPSVSPKDGLLPQVAIGNTSIDGVVAFARAAFEDKNAAPKDLTPQQAVDLLEAFQYNLLPMLGLPGAEAMLEQTIRQRWFGSTHAGTSWTIVAAPTLPGASPPPAPGAGELAKEASWLSALNKAQAAFDAAMRDLIGVQRDLFELWWKKGAATIYYQQSGWTNWPWTVTSSEQFDTAMQPLIVRARALHGQLQSLSSEVPIASAAVSLSQAITNFARSKGLPPTRMLKAVAAPRYWGPGDPVVVISKTAHTLKLEPDTTLPCRWAGELASQLSVSAGHAGPQFTVTSSEIHRYVPAMPWTNLPAAGQALFEEFVLLDPANAALAAAAAGQQLTPAQLDAVAASMSPPKVTTGRVPGILASYPWRQPWQPVYLDWEVGWFSIPFEQTNGSPNWRFNGLDYELVPGLATPSAVPLMLTGRAVLTPKPSFEFKARLDQFIRDYPGSPATKKLQEMEDLIVTVDAWDFLSQSLSGLHTQLAAWNPVPTQNPDSAALPGGGSLAQLIGDEVHMPPNPVSYDAPRNPTVPPSTFEGMRGGQFYLNRLTVVDAFGQTLEIVLAPQAHDQFPRRANNEVFHPLLSDGTAPNEQLFAQEPLRFAQLPPRVLQPARLNFRFLPQANDSPIVGWVLPNHVDSGLSVYDPTGTPYGELTVGRNESNQPVVDWIAAPNSPLPVVPEPSANQGPLLGLLANLKKQGSGALTDFLQALDETLWTVEPSGGDTDAFLSVLIGRPLAIVAASLSLELQAQAWRDSDWPYTFDPRPDPLLVRAGYRFPVRLGDLGYREDGLIGYFVDGRFDHFNAIHLPERGKNEPPLTGYLKAVTAGNYIDLGFAANGPGTPATLTMIMDPRGRVHAQCGFLPVKDVTLFPQWVESALAGLSVTFRTGPVLAVHRQLIPKGQTRPIAALVLSSPAERHGTWSWVESDGQGHWSETALTAADGVATFPDTPPTLRDGLLKLAGALKD